MVLALVQQVITLQFSLSLLQMALVEASMWATPKTSASTEVTDSITEICYNEDIIAHLT